MKKLLLLLPCLFLFGKAWALPDWAPSTEIEDTSQANYVSAKNAAVCHVTVTGIGVTAGDFIQLLNSATNTGTSQLTVVASGTNFTSNIDFGGSPCNLFTTGIYLKVSTSSGHMYTDIQYLNAI